MVTLLVQSLSEQSGRKFLQGSFENIHSVESNIRLTAFIELELEFFEKEIFATLALTFDERLLPICKCYITSFETN